MENAEALKTLKDVAAKIEKDTAKHEEYLAAAPSLEYHHYVAMIKPVDAIGCEQWTVRLTQYGAQLEKTTTAENFYKFTTRREAVAAAKSLRLVNGRGERIKHTYLIVSCREWHEKMIANNRENLETLKRCIANMELAA